MTNSPFERSVTSLAISVKATADDSGGGVTCAKTSFFGVAWAKTGALARATTPAAPAACRMRRRVAEPPELDPFTGVLPLIRSLARDYNSRVGAGNRGTALSARR